MKTFQLFYYKKHLLFILLFSIVIIYFVNTNNTKEGFIPAIKSIYKPYIRSMNTFLTSKFNRISLYSNNFFKKNKILT